MNQARMIALRLAQEPIVGFLLLGLVIFGVDRTISGAPAGDASRVTRIMVTASQQAALRTAFRAENGREPEAGELQTRLDRWIDEQVLYREALALGLDRKDLIVHRQLTQKMRLLLDNTASLPEPEEAALQAWLDRHPERYGHPGTVSFQHVFLSRGRHGNALATEAQRIAAQLALAPADFVGLGDAFLSGQVITDASATQLRRDFGPEFAEQLQAAADGRWSNPIPSGFGLHFVRTTARTDFRPAQLHEVAERVRQDYRSAQREAQTRQALDRLRQQYQVEIEGAAG